MERWLRPGLVLPLAVVAIAWADPGLLRGLTAQVARELEPLAVPAVWILILGMGFRWLLGGAKRRK